MEDDRKLRLFVGAEISIAAARNLASAAEAMRALPAARALSLRWLAPASYHVTLKFLGWVRAPTLTAIRDAVSEAAKTSACAPFMVRHQGLGAFPRDTAARVLWAGVGDGTKSLETLAAAVDGALCDLGFAAETRPFHPHVTLARAKAPGDAREILATASEQVYSQSRVDALIIYESHLKSTGSEYRVSARLALPGR